MTVCYCKRKHKHPLQREEAGAVTEHNSGSPHVSEGKSQKQGVKKKEALQPAGNTFRKMGKVDQRACDQTSTDTEEATAAIPEDDTSAQEKNLRQQTVRGEKRKKLRRDWKGWKKDDEDRKEESGEEGKGEGEGVVKGGGWAGKLGAGVERRVKDTQAISTPPNANHGKHSK